MGLHEMVSSRFFVSAASIFLLMMLISAYVVASTVYYIAPANEVPIRTGKSQRNKIVAVLADGSKVTVLKRDDEWSRVRTESGREGWILHRYLTSDTPLSIKVRHFEKENSALRQELESMKRQKDEAASMLDACDANLTECKATAIDIENSYISLQRDASEVVQIKEMLQANTKELSETRNRLAAAREELDICKNNNNIKWFLAGAGVLVVGWIAGSLAASRRRRSRPSLL